MNDTTCASCVYYKQHYILDGKKIIRIFCGHCTLKKKNSFHRSRRSFAPICEEYIPGTSDEEAFVSQEYLSKALLDRVLNLPLLPTIEDDAP